MKEFEQLLSSVAWIGIALLTVLLAIRIFYAWHTRRSRRGIVHAGWKIRVLHLAAAIGLAGLGYGLVTYLFVLQRGSAFMPISLKLTLAGLLLAWLLFEIVLHFWLRLPVSKMAAGRGVVGVLLCWGLAAVLISAFAIANRYPGPEESAPLEIPFDGEWVATAAGATGSTNHHNRIPSQRYAVDIAKACDDGRLFRGKGATLDESCTFGAVIRAPVGGKVVHVADGLPDIGSREQLAGNHIIIQAAEVHYVALAHLQQGSVLVTVGDTIRAGQPIGQAGNSGNSDFPHLHIHVQDGPVYDLRESRSIPFRFKDAEVKRYLSWRSVESAFLLSNDRIRRKRVWDESL
jgi:biotin carboxyl carrier protein